MAFGLIARADNRGLGIQTWAVHRNLAPAKTMVVNIGSVQPLSLHLERYSGATIVNGAPTRADMDAFLDGLDSVYTAETAYGPALWYAAEAANVRTVLHANFEFYNEADRPTVWAAPTVWRIAELPSGTVHLPVPIESDRLTLRPKPAVAQRFLHIVGRPAIHDRNGTPTLFEALQHVRSSVAVTVACQKRGYVEEIQRAYRIPDHVDVDVRATDTVNYWDNYLDVDALIMPRRFGGLCLPAQEAIGCGIPVIMPDVSPNGWLPKDMLVPAWHAGSFMAKQPVDLYTADAVELAAKIDRLAQDEEFYGRMVNHAVRLRDTMTWEALRPRYVEVLGL